MAGVAALLSLLRHFPLAWAMAAVPADVGTPSGTIWKGQLSDVPLFGQLTLSTHPTGVRLSAAADTDIPRKFTAYLRPGRAHDVSLILPVAALPDPTARLSALRGTVGLRVTEARWNDAGCTRADGTASTDVLAANAAQLGWAGPTLQGPVDCVEGRVRVRLSGEGDGATVAAEVLSGLDGVYRSEITVRAADPAAGNALVLYGFSPAGSGEYRLSEQGRWR